MRGVILGAVLAVAGQAVLADPGLPEGLVFGNIDGGQIALDDWRGRPMLIVNTASLCGFAPQFADMQALWEAHRDDGLIVLAIPSDDFRQELASEAEVRDYCDITYGIDMPMTTITQVTGEAAHPLYRWLADEHGFTPGWNFNKVLIGADGAVLGTWGSAARPDRGPVLRAVEGALGL